MLITARRALVQTRNELLAPPLTGGARVDVCIVGAGMAGMTAAYLLAREKRSVMVIDEGPIGGASSAEELSHLASVIEQPYFLLERLHGADAARLAAQGFGAATDAVEATVRRERIACEFERLDGYRLGGADGALPEARREVEAARRAGLGGVEVAGAVPVGGEQPGPCVRYPGQVHLHPRKYLAGLARAIAREGGRIHCGVRVHAVSASEPCHLVTAAGHCIEAGAVVSPSGAQPPAMQAAGVALRVPRGTITRALYWEAGPGIRCARLRAATPAGEVLLAAGTADAAAIEAWARERFPAAGEAVQRFAGELPQAADLFAFVGRRRGDARSVYVGTASWGSALTRAAIAGMAIRDFVEGARMPPGDAWLPSACYAARFEHAS